MDQAHNFGGLLESQPSEINNMPSHLTALILLFFSMKTHWKPTEILKSFAWEFILPDLLISLWFPCCKYHGWCSKNTTI